MSNAALHQPVLLSEVISHLAIRSDGVYFDATFGRGGHTQAILDRLGTQGRLLALDRDKEAEVFAKAHFGSDERFTFFRDSFSNIKKIAEENGVLGRTDGLLIDLGVSSPQLESQERGFSFLRNGPLDMRMDNTTGLTAADWLAQAKEKDIAYVLFTYGEERFSKRIAAAIVQERSKNPIVTTEHLARVVSEANPRWEKHKHPATRSFQAIRIWINEELKHLQLCLDQSLTVLAVGGRLAVISFHSLEDRLVKNFIRQHSCQPAELMRLPLVATKQQPVLRKLSRAIKPQLSEIQMNLRSRSAVLRLAERIV